MANSMNIFLLIVLPVAALGLLSFIAAKRGWLRPSTGAMLAAALYPFLAIFAWSVTRHRIDPSESTATWAMGMPSVAKAGFPINGLQLPPAPMASGYDSIQNVDVVFTHQLFWLAIAIVAA